MRFAIPVVFTVVALLFSGQVWLDYAYNDSPISWSRALLYSAFDWYTWAALVPFIAWLARRFPFTRNSWVRPLVIHAAVGLFILAVKTMAGELFVAAVGGPEKRPASFLQLYVTGLTYWVVLAVIIAVERLKEQRLRERQTAQMETELARARLESLRTQLQPHFLFNSLNGIAGTMRHDVATAETMITRLSDLLRITLDSSDREEVSLREELEFVNAYLELQQLRFGERLQVSIDAPQDELDAMVPIMSLQPLVENAIHHAVEQRPGPARVRISATSRGKRLVLQVEDDGPGPPAVVVEGTGLATTRGRLRHLHGAAAELSLEAISPAASQGNRGARATIVIPRRTSTGGR